MKNLNLKKLGFDCFLLVTIIGIFYIAIKRLFSLNPDVALLIFMGIFFIISFIVTFMTYKENIVERIFFSLFVATVVSSIATLMFLKKWQNFICDKSVILDKNNRIVQVIQERSFFWKNDPLFNEKKYNVFSYTEEEISLNFPGPKGIAYKIRIKTLGSAENLQLQRKEIHDGKVEEYVYFWLYEFNKAKENELGEIYNPENDIQQKKFYKLLYGFLESHLWRAGMSLESATFQVQTQQNSCICN